jgi:acyl carrier protein
MIIVKGNENPAIKKIFCEILGADESAVTDETAYNSFPAWDSLKHLQMVAAFETEFDIELEMDDIIDMQNFRLVKEIIGRNIDNKG